MPLTLWQATVDPCLCQRLLDTHRQVWLSLLWGHSTFLLGPGVHKVLFVPSKSPFPQSCGSAVIKPHWPSKSNSLGVLSPFAGSQVGKSLVGPRTFVTVWALFWYSFSLVCGLSARWLYGGANGNLLQEDLCHMPWLPGLLLPEPPSPQQATADLCLLRRHSNTQRQVWLSLLWGLWVLMHTRFCLSPQHLWWLWGLILNTILPLLPSYWGFSFALGCGISFFGGVRFSSVQFSCSVVSDSASPWTAVRQASLSITSSWSLLKLISIESVMPSNHLILCHILLLLPSIFPSIRD